MTTTFWWLVQNTITVAVLAVFVAALCRPLSKRPALQHLLWLVVLIKFVTPPIIVWPWSARSLAEKLDRSARGPRAVLDLPADQPHNLTTIDPVIASEIREFKSELRSAQPPAISKQSDVSSDALVVSQDLGPAMVEDVDSTIALEPSLGRPSIFPLATSSRATNSTDIAAEMESGFFQKSVSEGAFGTVLSCVERFPPSRLLPFVFGTWIIGSLVFAIAQCRRIFRHWCQIRSAKPAPKYLADEVRRFSGALGLGSLSTFIACGITSPFVWCVGRLRLLWPVSLSGPLEVSRCRGVIAHELSHVRRRDHWVAWLELLASVIWWWNPLFWYVRRRLREAAEIACDAMALSVLPDERRQYAEAFLELSSLGKTDVPVPILGVSTGSRRSFERRLRMILSESVLSMVSWRGLLAVGLLALVTLPSWSLGQAPSIEPQSASAPGSPTLSNIEPLNGSPTLENRLLQLNAVGAVLEAERAERAGKDHSNVVYDAGTFQLNRMPEKLQQVRKDLRQMRTGGELDPSRVAHAQRVLAELRRYEQAMHSTPQEIMIAEVFQPVLNRQPTPEEMQTWQKQMKDGGAPDAKAYDDLLWALLNSEEFLKGATAATADPTTLAQNRSLNTPAGGETKKESPRESGTLESRVQNLELKLDKILEEVIKLRAAGDSKQFRPDDPNSTEVRAISPDGKVIASAINGVVQLVDQSTNKTLCRTQVFGPKAAFESLSFSPDGKALVARSGNRNVILDVSTGKIIQSSAPDDNDVRDPQTIATQVRAFALSYTLAHEIATILQQLEIANVKIAADQATNRLLVNGTSKQLTTITELISKLDRPTNDATGKPSLQSTLRQEDSTSQPARDNQTVGPYGASGTHLDIVQIGTSIIEARGELRLAQSQYDRIKALSRTTSVSQEELESSQIKLEVAQQKVNLFTSFARSANNAARAEVQAARIAADHARKMVEKGYTSAAQFEQANARVQNAEMNLQVVESILNPPAAERKEGSP